MPGPHRHRTLLSIAALMLAVAPALADRIWIKSLPAQDVSVREVRNGNVVFFVGGQERTTPLDDVSRFEVDGQQQLNAAEEAYQGGDWATAATRYDDVVGRRGSDEWVRRRATFRLVDSAAKAGLFSQAASGYVALVNLDAAAAAGRAPDATAAGVTAQQIEDARGRVRNGLGSAGSNQEARRQLLTFLLQLDNAAGDGEAAANTVNQLGELVGDEVPDDRAAWPTYARVTLGRAQASLANDDFARARALVTEAGPTFDSDQLKGDALLMLARIADAEAKDGDRAAKLDAAYAYLKAAATTPQVESVAPRALLAAGDLHRQLGLNDDAADLYRAVIAAYADSPVAAEAQKRLAEG